MAGSDVPRLITIPISHFCEKARWALDRTGVPYREERHVQLVHRCTCDAPAGGTTAPVLVAADGVFTESSDIVAWADRRLDPADRLLPEEADARAEVERLVTELRRATSARTAAGGSTGTSCPTAASG